MGKTVKVLGPFSALPDGEEEKHVEGCFPVRVTACGHLHYVDSLDLARAAIKGAADLGCEGEEGFKVAQAILEAFTDQLIADGIAIYHRSSGQMYIPKNNTGGH